MAIGNEFVLHGINLPGGTFLSQITSSRLTSGIQQLVTRGAGIDSPMVAGQVFAAPRITFTTEQVASLLTLTGNNCSVAQSGNIDLYFRRVTPEAARDSLVSTTAW